MPYMIGSRSVTGGISLFASKSKLVYSNLNLTFVDNKLINLPINITTTGNSFSL